MNGDKDNKIKKNNGYSFALSLAADLGWMIALPIIIFAIAGRYLDQKFNSSPILLLAGIFLSIIASSWIVYFKIIRVFADIEQQEKDKNNKTNKEEKK
ncbi:AtpZ/AtpI family protein [Candidatus Parcubacteria bacterium]|nr:MAG: AtpZ/AtpI family protein [Candidatus Parcubacteria bacterium]